MNVITTPNGTIKILEECRNNPVQYELLITRANGTVDSDATTGHNKKGKKTYESFAGVMNAVNTVLRTTMLYKNTVTCHPELDATRVQVNMKVLNQEPILVFYATVRKNDGTLRSEE